MLADGAPATRKTHRRRAPPPASKKDAQPVEAIVSSWSARAAPASALGRLRLQKITQTSDKSIPRARAALEPDPENPRAGDTAVRSPSTTNSRQPEQHDPAATEQEERRDQQLRDSRTPDEVTEADGSPDLGRGVVDGLHKNEKGEMVYQERARNSRPHRTHWCARRSASTEGGDSRGRDLKIAEARPWPRHGADRPLGMLHSQGRRDAVIELGV